MASLTLDELVALVRETYAPEGQNIWWQTYFRAGPEEQNRLALHLKLGAEGACS